MILEEGDPLMPEIRVSDLTGGTTTFTVLAQGAAGTQWGHRTGGLVSSPENPQHCGPLNNNEENRQKAQAGIWRNFQEFSSRTSVRYGFPFVPHPEHLQLRLEL